MSVKQFAAQMKVFVEELKAKGVSSLSCDSILTFLNSVEKMPNTGSSARDIEFYKANLQHAADSNRYQHERWLEAFRATINAGQGAMKSSFLLNGGGAIALLAFITHLAQFRPEKVPDFSACLLPFVYGVLAISITSGFSYLSQWFDASDKPWASSVAFKLNIFCILLGFSSYFLFLWGILSTRSAFEVYV